MNAAAPRSATCYRSTAGPFLELTAGTTRTRVILDHDSRAYSAVRVDRSRTRSRTSLRLGIYQIVS